VAFDETLAERIRLALADVPELYERLMFGGIAFMVSDQMTCGVIGDELVLRLGPEGAERALVRPHVRLMDFTGSTDAINGPDRPGGPSRGQRPRALAPLRRRVRRHPAS
jgi:hypothetical protein